MDDLIYKLKKQKINYDKLSFLAGDASPRKYYIIKQKKNHHVLMVDNDIKNLDKFIFLTEYLKDFVSVPKIIHNLKDSGILILENFKKNKYSEILSKSNREKLYKAATDALIFIHKKTIDIKLSYYDKHFLFEESNLFFEWFVDKIDKKKKNSIKNDFNKIFDKYLDKVFMMPKVFIHRDYHVDNLFFLGNKQRHYKCGWIDYQDALIGPCVYDLVSLTQDARVDVEKIIEENIIEYYLKEFNFINKNDFLFSYKVIAIQRHLKVLGIFSRLEARDKKKNYLKHIPRVIKLLVKNLKDKEFEPLNKILSPLLKLNYDK